MATDWRDTLGALLPDDYRPVEAAEAVSGDSSQSKPRLEIWLDRKRAGKTATIITGFEPGDDRAAQLSAKLKSSLATGGSCRGGEILIQGDRAERLVKLLADMGYKVKRR